MHMNIIDKIGYYMIYGIAGNVCEELNFAVCDFDGIPQTFCPQIFLGASALVVKCCVNRKH